MESLSQETGLITPEQEEFLQWRTRKNILKQVKKASYYFALAFLLEITLLNVLQFVFYSFSYALELTGFFNRTVLWEIADEMFAITYYLIPFLIPYLLYAKMVGFPLRNIPHGKPYVPVMLASSGIAMGISLAGSFLTMIILTFFQKFGLQPPIMPSYPSNAFAMALNLFSTLILPPIIEELVYRGILLGSLRKYGDGVAIVISALIFGLAHGNMAQMPYSFVLGLTMGFFVIKTNSIYTSMFIHFVNNLLATILEFVTMNMSDVGYQLVSSFETLFYIVAFIIAVLYLNIIRKADWKLHPINKSLSTGTITKTFFLTIPMFMVLIYMAFQILGSFT